VSVLVTKSDKYLQVNECRALLLAGKLVLAYVAESSGVRFNRHGTFEQG
jgi:hypothetical protein